MNNDEVSQLRADVLENAQDTLRLGNTADEELRTQSEWLKVTLASISDGVIGTDADARITFMNPMAEQVTGWSESDVLGRAVTEVFEIIDKASRQPLENQVQKAIKKGASIGFRNNTILIAKDRTEKIIDDSAAPILSDCDEVIGAILVFRDISSLNKTDEEKKGWGWLQAIHPDDQPRTIELWKESLTNQTLHENQFRIRTRDGSYRWFGVRAIPVFDMNGSVREWVGANTDITDRKLSEDTLRKLAADLSDMDRRKDEFLATLAHELRNPLAPIRSGLQLLQLPDIDDKVAEETKVMMERQLAQLVRLVDDLMDVSRIVTGKIELQKKPVLLSEVLNSAIETIRPLIEQMNHRLSLTLPENPIWLDVDLTRLAQVFLNLLNNASKYSEPNGSICIPFNATA